MALLLAIMRPSVGIRIHTYIERPTPRSPAFPRSLPDLSSQLYFPFNFLGAEYQRICRSSNGQGGSGGGEAIFDGGLHELALAVEHLALRRVELLLHALELHRALHHDLLRAGILFSRAVEVLRQLAGRCCAASMGVEKRSWRTAS